MALNVEEIFRHPELSAILRGQARNLLAVHDAAPRVSSVFATQQRWLLAHMALALLFRERDAGLRISVFLEKVVKHQVASRNTADAFLKEMQNYGFVEAVPNPNDKRLHPLRAAPLCIETLKCWLVIHLATLDAIDAGNRTRLFREQPESLSAIQPAIADSLLASNEIRKPKPTFSLFTWLNDGGIIMDWLIAGLADVDPGCDRIPSQVESFSNLANRLSLSPTHLRRKLREAEKMGSLGWLGDREKSAMWVSVEFQQEYHAAQAAKLAIIDAAFHAVFPKQDDPPNNSQHMPAN